MPGVAVDGPVDFQALLSAYANARLFLMPSERESFSMPLAEALSCGVPGLARDHPALRETGGNGALYLSSDDPADWAHAMDIVITDDGRHAHLRAEGLREARRFSWQTMVNFLLDDVA
jgi:glycosyltransferase involved in cell wall biosynthesis